MDYQQALELLGTPDTWCKGAAALAQIGNRDALVHLIDTYEQPTEAPKLCLLEAMGALDPVSGAQRLCNAPSLNRQRQGIHLMELFPDNSHLPLLAQAIQSPDENIRRQAARSIVTQPFSPERENLLLSMLSATDDDLRIRAIQGLEFIRRPHIRQALQERLAHESDAYVKQRLEDALKT